MKPKSDHPLQQILIDSFAPPVYDRIFRAVKDKQRAELILGKTFAYAIQHGEQHISSVRLLDWFMQIAHFKILDEAVFINIGVRIPDECPFGHYLNSWFTLQEAEQNILTLAVLSGIDPEEVAAGLNISSEQLLQRVSVAIARFHRLISRAPENP